MPGDPTDSYETRLVNGPVVRLGVARGEYQWHKHDGINTIQMTSSFRFVLPKGTLHRTRALQRMTVLMIEDRGIVPTGS